MNIFNKVNKKIKYGLYFCWGILGYYRGIQHYNFNYNLKLEKYNEKMNKYNDDLEKYNKALEKNLYVTPSSLPEKPNKFYITSIIYGLYGSLFYIALIPGIFYFFKEIYRTEIYLRNMDDEKEKEYFNTLEL